MVGGMRVSLPKTHSDRDQESGSKNREMTEEEIAIEKKK